MFVMVVGPSGSGKTFIINDTLRVWTRDAMVVSSDAIRAIEFGDVNDQTHNGEVFKIMYDRTVEYLQAGYDVFYDATNMGDKYRRELLKNLIAECGHDITYHCIVVCTNIETCLARNAARDRHVPEHVILRQVSQFVIPHKSEGWDKIHFFENTSDCYGASGCKSVIDDWPAAAVNFDQHSKYHSLDLAEHSILTYQMVIKLLHDHDIIDEAALYHDIGKYYLHTEDKEGYWHYYNHAGISAWVTLCGMMDPNSIDLSEHDYKVAWLINHHMDAIDSTKVAQYIIDTYGLDYLNLVYNFNLCDQAAH